jgi:hypothetical protein
MEYTTKLENVEEALQNCDLCKDTLIVELPDTPEYMFCDTREVVGEFMDAIEANIEAHGGYMIDEWMFVDERQEPMHVLNHVKLK